MSLPLGWGWRAALGLVVVGAVTASAAATALAVAPIRVPRIRVVPPVHMPLPRISERELAVAAQSAAKYGDEAAPVETRLDDLRWDADRGVDADVEAIGRTTAAREGVRSCVSDGLQAAGEGYGEALADYAATGTHEFPGVYRSFGDAASACIESQTDAPADVVKPVAEYLAGHVQEQFVTVARTTESGLAQQRWLELLATDVAAPEDVPIEPSSAPPSSTSPTSSDDSSAGLIAGVAGGLVLLALAGGIAVRLRRGA